MTSTDYFLPALPSGGSEITIVRWLKHPGDRVAAGEPLLLVVNDRVEVALPATCAGILDRALAAEGAAVAAGAPLATIAAVTSASSIDAQEAADPDSAASSAGVGSVIGSRDPAQPAPLITPVARRIANLEQVDITILNGSGISGRIVKADLLAALASQSQVQPATAYSLISSASDPIAKSPDRSLVPLSVLPGNGVYVLTAIDVDMQRVVEAVARLGPGYARRRLELNHTVCVALAAVAALPCHPLLNSSWNDAMIVARRRVHLAVASRDGSLRIIRDAQDLNLRGLARGFGGKPALSANLDQDSTFVLADLGCQILGDPSPLARGCGAALAVGAVRPGPLVIDEGGIDRLAIRRVAVLALAYDVRLFGQFYADAYLRDIKRRLERFDI